MTGPIVFQNVDLIIATVIQNTFFSDGFFNETLPNVPSTRLNFIRYNYFIKINSPRFYFLGDSRTFQNSSTRLHLKNLDCSVNKLEWNTEKKINWGPKPPHFS